MLIRFNFPSWGNTFLCASDALKVPARFAPLRHDEVFLFCLLQKAKTKGKHFITFFAWLFMYCYVFYRIQDGVGASCCFLPSKKKLMPCFNLTLFSEFLFSDPKHVYRFFYSQLFCAGDHNGITFRFFKKNGIFYWGSRLEIKSSFWL